MLGSSKWDDLKYGNNKGALVEYKVGTSMTLPATWAEKGKAVLPLSGICVRKPQFSKPLDEEDDLRLSNMNFFKVSDLKLKKTITPVVYTGTIRERQMKNYIDYLSASLGSTLGNLERICGVIGVVLRRVCKRSGCMIAKSASGYCCPPRRSTHGP